MSELKPCPFCGKEQSEENFFSCDGYPQACGCWETTHTGEEACEVWNTRPIEDALRAEIARKDEIISRLKEDGERLFSNLTGISVCAYEDAITLHRALMEELNQTGELK